LIDPLAARIVYEREQALAYRAKASLIAALGVCRAREVYFLGLVPDGWVVAGVLVCGRG
jgi:hypothetical protein